MIYIIRLWIAKRLLYAAAGICPYFIRWTSHGPRVCYRCRCTTIKEVVTDRMDYTTMEKKFVCCKCNAVLDYWCTGNYQSQIELYDKGDR